MNGAEHTPTPWYVAGGKTIRYGAKGEGGDGWIGKANWQNGEANAEFIIRAVNTHDDLVAALKEAIAELDECGVRLNGEGFNNPAWNELLAKADGSS